VQVYLRPWKDWVREGGGRAVMVAHNPLNGLPLVAHRHYLTTVLRDELAGPARPLTLASDGSDVSHLHSTWRVARSLGEAGALAMQAGLDQELQTDWKGFAFEAAAASDLLSPRDLKRAVGNVLRLKFLAGLFDEPGPAMPDPSTVTEAFQHADARRLSYEAAVQSAVLLINKNSSEGGLPLDVTTAAYRSVLLLGPNAGCVAGSTGGGGGGERGSCPARSAAMGGYYAPTSEEDIATLEDAVRAFYGSFASSTSSSSSESPEGGGVRVAYHPGASVCSAGREEDFVLLEAAVEALEARQPDLVVLGLGDNSDADARECQQCGEGRDRTSLDLSGGQLSLLGAVLDAVSRTKQDTGRVVPVVGALSPSTEP
jgi:beta-glucosidase